MDSRFSGNRVGRMWYHLRQIVMLHTHLDYAFDISSMISWLLTNYCVVRLCLRWASTCCWYTGLAIVVNKSLEELWTLRVTIFEKIILQIYSLFSLWILHLLLFHHQFQIIVVAYWISFGDSWFQLLRIGLIIYITSLQLLREVSWEGISRCHYIFNW